MPRVTLVFAAAALLGSALLFWVELLVGRLLLPLLGGAPAVWNTCMVFFQAALLGGYALAHALSAGLSARTRLAAHALLIVAPAFVLPLALPPGAAARLAAGAEPLPWLLATLAATVGLPFVALAATTPLLQDWAARSGHPQLADPYPLNALSNLGSLLALAAFPFVLEPHLTIAQQLKLWSGAFALWAVLVLSAAAWSAFRARATASAAADAEHAPPLGFLRRARWVILALVPSSLLLGVTAHISLDIAAVPLLWILPLILYLATFVVAFARAPLVTARSVDHVVPGLVLVMVTPLVFHFVNLLWLPVYLIAFAAIALLCHLRLAEDRPPASHLTEYYLWLSLGGVLGGLFNALLAPVMFNRLLELPLMLVIACLLRPPAPRDAPATGPDGWFAIVIGALCVNVYVLGFFAGQGSAESALRFALLFPLFLSYKVGSRRMRFAVAIATLMLTGEMQRDWGDEVLYRERTFFGVLRVVREESLHRQKLVHGQVLHGVQPLGLDGALEPELVAYYDREGPCGELFAEVARRDAKRVGVVGLGIGCISGYARPGDRWRFYEIDPAVIALARNSGYFNFLASCHAAELDTVAGDARLMLKSEPRDFHDLLILDAFSSDAVPVHLVTREAVSTYLDALSPDGLLVFHVSNLYVDLEPLLAELARDRGLTGRVRHDTNLSDKQLLAGRVPTVWVVLARSEAGLGTLLTLPRWKPLRTRAGVRAWTDDHSSLLDILR